MKYLRGAVLCLGLAFAWQSEACEEANSINGVNSKTDGAENIACDEEGPVLEPITIPGTSPGAPFIPSPFPNFPDNPLPGGGNGGDDPNGTGRVGPAGHNRWCDERTTCDPDSQDVRNAAIRGIFTSQPRLTAGTRVTLITSNGSQRFIFNGFRRISAGQFSPISECG
jgi:hypothetical protein